MIDSNETNTPNLTPMEVMRQIGVKHDLKNNPSIDTQHELLAFLYSDINSFKVEEDIVRELSLVSSVSFSKTVSRLRNLLEPTDYQVYSSRNRGWLLGKKLGPGDYLTVKPIIETQHKDIEMVTQKLHRFHLASEEAHTISNGLTSTPERLLIALLTAYPNEVFSDDLGYLSRRNSNGSEPLTDERIRIAKSRASKWLEDLPVCIKNIHGQGYVLKANME